MSDFTSMFESLNSPPLRHAMLVHIPIVLTIVGFVFALLAAMLRSNLTLRALAIACHLALVLSIFITINSGESAEIAIEQVLTPEVYDIIAEHEDLARKTWMFAVGVILLLSLSSVVKGVSGAACAWLAVAASLVSIAWMSLTAHHGGTLVYAYGVGTPQPVACFDIPGVHSDGRDHQAEHAARQAAAGTQPANASEAGAAESAVASPPSDAEVQTAFFLDQVYPILAENCFNCHNQARAARDKSGALDQTSREALLKGGHGGPAIVPGDPDSSLLIQRMRSENEDDIMPPDGRLADKDIDAIAEWIRNGAVWAQP